MLIVAATPIGNLGDVSDRLRSALAEADVIAAEDTRVTGKLIALTGVETSAQLVAVHDHDGRAIPELVERARTEQVLVVSDAGMPGISDPGFEIVRSAIDAGIEVTVVPGPVAFTAALVLSGLPIDRFIFDGFLPRKAGERSKRLRALANEPRTLVFYESPHRIDEALDAMIAHLGADRPAALVREITKKFEETRRGTLAHLRASLDAAPAIGEICLVVGGAPVREPSMDDALARVEVLRATGLRLKDAVSQAAETVGVRKRELYERALEANDEPE